MTILGLSCWYHDSAACLLRDGEIVAAAQEERFSRKKHDPSFPRQAVDYCLEEGNVNIEDLDLVAFYEKPFLKFERLLETYLSYAPVGAWSFLKAMPIWIRRKLWIPDLLRRELEYDGRILYPEHHHSHAASAFYPSPFSRAAIITTDGVGEWATTSWGIGHGSSVQISSEVHFPHSLGLLYSALTYFCGFRVNSGEYKLMGLAPYGEPTYVDVIRDKLIDLKEDGSFRLNMKYFTYPHGLRMVGRRFARLFGGPPRVPESAVTKREMDLARSVQAVVEDALIRMANHVYTETGEKNLCLAGGVALNCVANARILASTPFERIWIQPAAGDAGGALGAAAIAWHEYAGYTRQPNAADSMQGALLGPSYSGIEVKKSLEAYDLPYQELPRSDKYEAAAKLLAEGAVVGWFQGRMEYGPRALGNRSILADPRGTDMQHHINQAIKFRESFRPFAPSVLDDHTEEYFGPGEVGSYMLLVAQVRGAVLDRSAWGRSIDSRLPAVTHVDGSARVQVVSEQSSPDLARVLRAFERLSGCPVLVNTSFNVRGEPIVCTPTDAVRCFLATRMDALIVGNCIVRRSWLLETVGYPASYE